MGVSREQMLRIVDWSMRDFTDTLSYQKEKYGEESEEAKITQEHITTCQSLHHLVEKVYGEWQKDANNLNIDFVEWPELVVLIESIRDFDPIKEAK